MGLTANVIIDGEIMAENLRMIGLDQDWLQKELRKQHYNRISQVILATVDSGNVLTVYGKTGKNVRRTPID